MRGCSRNYLLRHVLTYGKVDKNYFDLIEKSAIISSITKQVMLCELDAHAYSYVHISMYSYIRIMSTVR